MKLEIGAIGIYVKDMKKMVGFYRDALGYAIEWDGGCFACVRMLNGFFFNLCERDSTGRFSFTDGINGTFQISCGVSTADDVNREYMRLLELGANPVYPPTTEPYGMRVSFVADPEGNQIEICASLDD